MILAAAFALIAAYEARLAAVPAGDLLALLSVATTPEEDEAFALVDAHEAAQAAVAEAELQAEAEACRCPKCNGSGRLGQYYYNQGGTCFPCDGTGIRGYARYGR